MKKIKYIVIHCTATQENRSFNAHNIDIWHKQRGWSGIGYHYVIKLDGSLEKGRPESKRGAHVLGHNHESLGVVYVGGLDKSNTPKDTRTSRQKEALRCLLIELKFKYPNAKIVGHRDLSKDLNGNGIIEPFEFMKQCPCFDAKTEYNDL